VTPERHYRDIASECHTGARIANKNQEAGRTMSYVDKNLMPREQVIYRGHLHWAVYFSPAMLILIALAIIVVSLVYNAGAIVNGIGGFILFIGLCGFLLRWIRVKTSEFAVTDKRVIIKTGVIRRRSIELLLRQVEAIRVEQGIMGRILGYGTIIVGGTGGTAESFSEISNPLEFRRQVQIQSSS
jgi:uncharacterized membrane protein YdbT with pleckstrin-like domain